MTDTWGEAARKAAQYHKQADRKPTMKIDDATYTKAIALVMDMAKSSERLMTSRETSAFYDMAIEIAASLPKPVDPEKEAVRELMRASNWNVDGDESIAWKVPSCVDGLAIAAFRAGRAFERENG